MLDKNFTPPKQNVSTRETKKRIKIIEQILPELSKYSTAILLTGSMAYGQDFSVTPDSDIDLQLMTNMEKIAQINSCKFFQKYNTEKIIQWFTEWIFEQFSISCIVKEVKIECHFWNEKTFKEILQYKKEETIRLRSQTKKIMTDYAYSFDGTENTHEYPDYKKEKYNLWIFPSFRVIKNKLFLARPLTHILGNVIKLYDACDIKSAIREFKNITKQKLADTPREKWKTYSFFNTLPEKNKVSEEVLERIEDITVTWE